MHEVKHLCERMDIPVDDAAIRRIALNWASDMPETWWPHTACGKAPLVNNFLAERVTEETLMIRCARLWALAILTLASF